MALGFIYPPPSNITLYIHAFFNTNVYGNNKYKLNKYSFSVVFCVKYQL